MNFDPHFIAALVGLIVSEVIPIITKSRYGGIIHALVSLLGRLYSAPTDISGLSAQIVALQEQIEKMNSPEIPDTSPAQVAPTPSTAQQG